MTENKFYVGQKLKNSPTDEFPYFEIVSITESMSGLKFYRVKDIYQGEELVLHEEDLYPYEEVEESEVNVKVVNENVTSFEEGKTYIFKADKIEVREIHKWADVIDNEIVRVTQPSLGFITMKRENRLDKEMYILPKFCIEVEILNNDNQNGQINEEPSNVVYVNDEQSTKRNHFDFTKKFSVSTEDVYVNPAIEWTLGVMSPTQRKHFKAISNGGKIFI